MPVGDAEGAEAGCEHDLAPRHSASHPAAFPAPPAGGSEVVGDERVDFSTWRVLVGPKNMTPDEIAWWDSVLKKATSSPEWIAAAKRNLWTVDYKNSAETKVFLNEEQKRLTSLLTDLGLAK